jgi:hypothetical protein
VGVLIVEMVEWSPPSDPTTLVALRVALHERDPQQAIRRAGGAWNRSKQVWEPHYDQVVVLGLSNHF